MQNGTLNGKSQLHENAASEPEGESKLENLGDNVANNHSDEPPSKRCKLADSSERSTPRPPSPPWKRAGFDGPTSFVEGGKRRSTRTNILPLQLQPQSDKRHTRSARKEYVNTTRSSRGPRRETSSSSSPSVSSKAEANGRKSAGGNIISNGHNVSSPRKDPLRSSNSKSVSVKQAGSQTAIRKRASISSRSQAPTSTNKPSDTINHRAERITRRENDASFPNSPVAIRNGHATEDVERENGNYTDECRHQRLPRLRFKVKMPSLGVQNPSHVLPPRKYSSFREWVGNDTAIEDETNFPTGESAAREARIRRRVYEAGEPNEVLSKERCSYYLGDPEEEPPRQYSHQDHLVAHALNFKMLLDKERKHHRSLARGLAQACADVWRKRNKLPEDILKEQQDEVQQKRRQLIKDLQRQFGLVRVEVDKARQARWEQERKAEDQLALNNAIQKSTLLFERRRMDRVDSIGDDPEDLDDGTDVNQEETSMGADESDNESNMSSGSESEEEQDGHDDDEKLSAEALRAKYAHLNTNDISTGLASDSGDYEDAASPGSIVHKLKNECSPEDNLVEGNKTYSGPLEEVDHLLLDNSDESTDMDDDMGDSSDSEMCSEDSDADDRDYQGPGLLGLFPEKEFAIADDAEDVSGSRPVSQQVDDDKDEDDDDDDDEEVHLVPNGPKVNPDIDINNDGTAQIDTMISPPAETSSRRSTSHELQEKLSSHSEADSSAELAVQKDPDPVDTPRSVDQAASTKTPIPHLLRGTLREYQHFGLDWLAGLYTSNINGILADEMGLGKTIQTIALLAHLAVEHEVWGPHLVVVPTSVMLNWEMEFKKWCPGFKILTYYGSQEERKMKRKGWMDDDRWHVCITSYQLVLQDQQIFRRRNWHYMVLDEAHNIKNFRSQRWQTLLTFKTQARLLLTGTPLQNNLTELWSLLFFLMPSDENGDGVEGFADLRNFSEWFRRPVEQILEHGRETMDDEAKKVVTKLHTILRPYILRRLKVDVEKQMPAKYEHVVTCRLSKRQRYLYDGFMSRAQTKETLASGNYLSIINCLMQLRKVCNHPDLFETRPITTSFAMSNSVIADFEIKDLLVRRRLLCEDALDKLDLDFMNLAPISREDSSRRLVDDTTRIMAYNPLRVLRERQYSRTSWHMDFDGSSVRSTLTSMENTARKIRMDELERCLYFESKRHGQRPIYGKSLLDLLTIEMNIQPKAQRAPPRRSLLDWFSRQSPVLDSMVLSIEERSLVVEPLIQKFACLTPSAIARGVTEAALTPIKSRYFTPSQRVPSYDPFHETQMRLSIAFPDKRLLQYDCGKLQQLDKLLRKLQTGGHRALIFTQMTKMLDILEQFLNIHGHRYLRLDGATKIEQRQLLTERFNNDNRILAFILSSRSGGLGINLTGADTVIFYDLDWNPAMDKQCQDRCHRIGQTRDVHIYRFVSEYTIESNILRKANQKRMLDDVVIQEGGFTTDYLEKLNVLGDEEGDTLAEGLDEAGAAMDRVLDTKVRGTSRVFEQAEDKEDIDAAKTAEKELEHADDGDFEEGSAPHTPGQPVQNQVDTPIPTEPGECESTLSQANNTRPGSPLASTLVGEGDADVEVPVGHIDDYLIRFMEWNVKDEPLILPADKSRKRSKRREHRVKRHR